MDQLVLKTTAVLAKEKRFNEDCEMFFNGYYIKGARNINGLTNYDEVTGKRNDFTSLPTQTQLQKWIREKFDIHIEVKLSSFNGEYSSFYTVIVFNLIPSKDNELLMTSDVIYQIGGQKKYEDALETGIINGLSRIEL